ncbi:MAG: polyphosphate kinase 2 [Bosea sp. (in: a-proteobacteria)]
MGPAKASAKTSAKTSTKAAPKPEKKKSTAKAPIFDIKNPKLPEVIDDNALASGGYPYHEKMKRKKYEKRIIALQIELLKMLAWAKDKGERVIVVFEGRDGAGKGGTISRFTQHMPSRQARIVALSKPSDSEKGQWYFQRYAREMPTRGEIVFFDRSWYNRAGVELVMGFASAEESEAFLREAPAFEGMLARDGIRIIKLFFSIGREMQMKRLHARFHDPLKHWKLSPIDFEAIPRFDAYSEAFNTMLGRTHIERAPWTIIRSNDKLRARIAAMQAVLSAVPYDGKDKELVEDIDPKIMITAPDWIDAGGER